MTDHKKWACDYCTYENWGASKKCTLCCAVRPLQYITEPATSSQDIYKMASLMHQPSGNTSLTTSQNTSQPSTSDIVSCLSESNPDNKWACQLCTYLNWPKALRCTQCLHERHKPVPKTSPVKDKSTFSTPLSINVNIAEASGGCSPNTDSVHQSPPRSISPSSPEAAAKIGNNNRNRTMSSAVSAAVRGKWICSACTYENWIKSTKCVLCAAARGQQVILIIRI